jgi:hypothetical protein
MHVLSCSSCLLVVIIITASNPSLLKNTFFMLAVWAVARKVRFRNGGIKTTAYYVLFLQVHGMNTQWENSVAECIIGTLSQ